ncbi:uncharacterized protein YcsI (UPF0317 family) [Roseibium hamelinense]|uniref:Putative hydro-lyase JM93_00072 n=1 Tax=Roseibium hamelinense TaxID=150831 RepID=A0A562TIR6_9HYPH|nr:putative hydro-lyase [Roseibium hamelinense]MTI43123.1 putative hydro-lyase [Roseibium hamelinense]TWI92530.1 uncharacterized protein YcsI (UPF0317 family) [Roseibium hamelinense]
MSSFEQIRTLIPAEARAAIRTGAYGRHTAGLAAGYLQANLVVLPETHALDFARFCQRNPKPCPVVGMTDAGSPKFRTLGQDVDLCRDVPSYNVYEHGVLTATVPDISDLWQDDFVGFALGCSFTFENALIAAGIPVRHIDMDTTVPMYRTSIALTPAGPFSGTMVVSMRPIAEARVSEAIAISSRFPLAHGAPVHTGNPGDIGIADLRTPDWGEPVDIEPGEIPCFWACGVTPQAVLLAASLPMVITHTPGHMLITDVPETADIPVIQSD